MQRWSPLVLFAVVYGSLIAASEIGFRIGRLRQPRTDEKAYHLEEAVQTASLGLMALLLGFSFSLAASRYDSRNQVIVHEANAITTAYFDAELLPEPHRSEMAATFRRYVVLRIHAYDLGTEVAADSAIRSWKLQEVLWKEGMAAARDQRVPPEFATAVSRSLSQVADTSEAAMSAFENRLPESMVMLLFAVAGIATWIAGYCDGERARRLILVIFIQPLLIALVITVITDMDEPFTGWLHVIKSPLERAQESMK
jgi:hypothetical protein